MLPRPSQTLALIGGICSVIEPQAGGIKAEYGRFFNKSQARVRTQFTHYQKISRQYQVALAQAGPHANDAWEKYPDSLEARHHSWGRDLIKHKRRDGHLVVEKAVEQTRKAVRQSGIPVPVNWNTGDLVTFAKVARQKYTRKVQATFDTQLNGVPIHLDWNAFMSPSTIQKSWREVVGYPAQAEALPPGKLSLEQFRERLYNPTLSHRANTSLASYSAAVQSYRDAGAKAAKDRQALRRNLSHVWSSTLCEPDSPSWSILHQASRC